jgi:hypothetical protein
MGRDIGLNMAKTKRDKIKNKFKRFHRAQRLAPIGHEFYRVSFRESYRESNFLYEEQALGGQLMNDPNWWNHLYDIVPARRRTKALLDKIKKVPGVAEEIIFPDFKRPHIYYW